MNKHTPLLLCYDIRDPKRLQRVHNCVKKVGLALQYSVFYLEMSNADVTQLLNRLSNIIDDSRDDRIKSTLNPIFRKNSNLDYKPLILTTPRPTGKDSLIKIRGINSKIEIEEAKAQKKEAEMNYYPKVNATLFGMKTIDPLFKYSVQGGNLPVYDGNPANLQTATQFAYFPGINLELLNQLGVASANVTQTVYAGNRIKTGNELAKLNIDVKEKQQKLAQKEVLLKTEKEYWQVITLQEKLKTVESYENFLKKLHKEVSDAKKNGLAIRNDVL